MIAGQQDDLRADRIKSRLDKYRRSKQFLVMIQYRIHKLLRIRQAAQAGSSQDSVDRRCCSFQALQPDGHAHTDYAAHTAAKGGIRDQELVIRLFQGITAGSLFKSGGYLFYVNRFHPHKLFIGLPEKQGSIVPSEAKRVRQYGTQRYSFLITGNGNQPCRLYRHGVIQIRIENAAI